MAKKKKESSNGSWRFFGTKGPTPGKWVKVAQSYVDNHSKHSTNQLVKRACWLMLREIKIETITSAEKQTPGMETLAENFQSLWEKYEDGNSQEAQETYLTQWVELYDEYRTIFFQNCDSIAHYLDENEIQHSWALTWSQKLREDTRTIRTKFVKRLEKSINKQSNSLDKTLRIKNISGIICYQDSQ